MYNPDVLALGVTVPKCRNLFRVGVNVKDQSDASSGSDLRALVGQQQPQER